MQDMVTTLANHFSHTQPAADHSSQHHQQHPQQLADQAQGQSWLDASHSYSSSCCCCPEATRGIVVNWMVEVASLLRLGPLSLAMAVELWDAFMCEQAAPPPDRLLQLVALSCLALAARQEGDTCPTPEECASLTMDPETGSPIYQPWDFSTMDLLLGETLEWRILRPTPYAFLQRLLHCLGSDPRVARRCWEWGAGAGRGPRDLHGLVLTEATATATAVVGMESSAEAATAAGPNAEWLGRVKACAYFLTELALPCASLQSQAPSTLATASLELALQLVPSSGPSAAAATASPATASLGAGAFRPSDCVGTNTSSPSGGDGPLPDVSGFVSPSSLDHPMTQDTVHAVAVTFLSPVRHHHHHHHYRQHRSGKPAPSASPAAAASPPATAAAAAAGGSSGTAGPEPEDEEGTPTAEPMDGVLYEREGAGSRDPGGSGASLGAGSSSCGAPASLPGSPHATERLLSPAEGQSPADSDLSRSTTSGGFAGSVSASSSRPPSVIAAALAAAFGVTPQQLAPGLDECEDLLRSLYGATVQWIRRNHTQTQTQQDQQQTSGDGAGAAAGPAALPPQPQACGMVDPQSAAAGAAPAPPLLLPTWFSPGVVNRHLATVAFLSGVAVTPM